MMHGPINLRFIWSLLRASNEVTRRTRTFDCSATGEELLRFVLDAIVVDMECVEKLGLITVSCVLLFVNLVTRVIVLQRDIQSRGAL